ncbi:hypothetical protein H8959_006714 [Pygathrix nigripes]
MTRRGTCEELWVLISVRNASHEGLWQVITLTEVHDIRGAWSASGSTGKNMMTRASVLGFHDQKSKMKMTLKATDGIFVPAGGLRETQHPGFLLRATHIRTFCLAYAKIPTPRRKADAPHKEDTLQTVEFEETSEEMEAAWPCSFKGFTCVPVVFLKQVKGPFRSNSISLDNLKPFRVYCLQVQAQLLWNKSNILRLGHLSNTSCYETMADASTELQQVILISVGTFSLLSVVAGACFFLVLKYRGLIKYWFHTPPSIPRSPLLSGECTREVAWLEDVKVVETRRFKINNPQACTEGCKEELAFLPIRKSEEKNKKRNLLFLSFALLHSQHINMYLKDPTQPILEALDKDSSPKDDVWDSVSIISFPEKEQEDVLQTL